MVAFYKSPTGVKALREMPKVMADVGAQMAPRMQACKGDLNARMRAILEKHGYKNKRPRWARATLRPRSQAHLSIRRPRQGRGLRHGGLPAIA